MFERFEQTSELHQKQMKFIRKVNIGLIRSIVKPEAPVRLNYVESCISKPGMPTAG